MKAEKFAHSFNTRLVQLSRDFLAVGCVCIRRKMDRVRFGGLPPGEGDGGAGMESMLDVLDVGAEPSSDRRRSVS